MNQETHPVVVVYSRTKLVCEKWNGTQRHKDTELYFLREQSSQSICVQYKGLTDFSQSIAD